MNIKERLLAGVAGALLAGGIGLEAGADPTRCLGFAAIGAAVGMALDLVLTAIVGILAFLGLIG